MNSSRMRIRQLPIATFRIVFILLAIIFSSHAVHAADFGLEKDLQSKLEQSKKIVETARMKQKSGTATLQEATRLKSLSEDVAASHMLLKERFKVREQKVKGLNSKAKKRHQAATEGYTEALDEYLGLVDSIPKDGSIPNRTLKKLEKLLNKIVHKKTRPIIGSLPYKHLGYAAKEPATSPVVIPAYRGGAATINAEDTEATAEAPLSPEIVALAQSLNWNPVSIYEYVKNNIETEWYWGCMKGAEETLHQKSGNDCDQAALFVALLRASGYPSRYIRGTVEFFPDIEKAKNLTGVSDPARLGEFFQKAGIPYRQVMDGATIKNIQIEHVYVETFVPYSNYRGAVMDNQGKTWLALDTSIKAGGYAENQAGDILSEMSFSSMRDDYLLAVQTGTPLEYLTARINEYLLQTSPTKTYTDYLSTRTLNPEVMQILPSSLQFKETAITGEYTAIPNELIHNTIFTAKDQTNNELFSISIENYKLSNKKMLVSYEPETVEDQEIIDEYGGLDNTPGYLVRLRPVLNLEGERMIVAKDGLPMGADYTITIDLVSPAGTQSVTDTLINGNLSAIGIVSQKAVIPAPVADEQRDAGRLLYEEALNYVNRWNQAEDELASLMRVKIVRPIPTLLVVGGVIDVTYLLDQPYGGAWKGVYLDANVRAVETVRSLEFEVGSEKEKTFMQLSGLQGSVLESRIFEDDFQVGSISTAKLFGVANSQQSQIPVLTIDQISQIPVLLDENIKTDISAAISDGLIIKIPVDVTASDPSINYENWTGTGYIKENISTGEAGYMLSGSIAGGMTAWSMDRWPAYYASRLSNPWSEIAIYDSSSATFIQKITATDMQKGIAGKSLEQSLQVVVFDQSARTVANASVTFTVKKGAGTLVNGSSMATSLTVTTNPCGIASVTLILGQNISDNGILVQGNPNNEQVGENIVDAALPSGTAIAVPFSAYGFPGTPDHIHTSDSPDGVTSLSSILSFAGFVSVVVEDVYHNPISNLAMDFHVGDATENSGLPYCNDPTAAPQKTYLVPPGLGCLNDSPNWGQCGDTNKQALSTSTSRYGAAAQIVLGGAPDSIYPITVTCTDAKCNLSEKFTHTFRRKTLQYGNCGEGTTPPSRSLLINYSYPADSQGHSINAGKSGAEITLKAKLSALIEGQTTKNVDLACSGGTMSCENVIGSKQYQADTTDANFTSATMQLKNQSGEIYWAARILDNSGLYQESKYKLKPGVNDITITGSDSVNSTWTDMACPGTCNTKEEDTALTETATMRVYGVDITVNTLPIILLDEWGYAAADYNISYSMAPAEYTALNAYVLIYKAGNVIASIPVERNGAGWGAISRGFRFDVSNIYEVEVVVNMGTGVEIRSEKRTLQFNVLQVIFVDNQDNQRTEAQIGDDDNFVSWSTLSLKYKILPELPDSDYDWEVVKGTPTVGVHDGLGTPVVKNPDDQTSHLAKIDKTNKLIQFIPGSTDSKLVASRERAKPLAFKFNFKYKGEAIRTFDVQQSGKNTIREEYMVYSADYSNITVDNLPKHSDFDISLEQRYWKACAYNASEIPGGDNLNRLGIKLDSVALGKYSITSSYRNPFRNDTISKSMNSRHVWSDAFDLRDSKGGATTELQTEVWAKIKDLPEFGQVIIESQDPTVSRFVTNYLKGRGVKYIEGSVWFWVDQADEDPKIQYEILWSKRAGYQTIYIRWEEAGLDEPQYEDYTFKLVDWSTLVENLHAQGYPLSVWGF